MRIDNGEVFLAMHTTLDGFGFGHGERNAAIYKLEKLPEQEDYVWIFQQCHFTSYGGVVLQYVL
jgi:hypothetical protein